MSPKSIRRTAVAVLLTAVAGLLSASPVQAQSPSEGPGGPVLVVTDPGDRFGDYYAEILRAEGLNEFAVGDVGSLSAQSLAEYQVVVLAQTGLTAAQATLLQSWVEGGGNLIAMRPDPKLAGLLGLGADTGDLANGYLQVGAGRGITGEPMQFHDTADRWTLNGATTVATLYANATSATSNPAVTLRSVGSAGGQAAAFTYDLARSVVYTRQGNPAWEGQERDSGVGGSQAIRSDDLFFGGAEADWVDLNKVSIPQADEQQRLLANLVTQMSSDRMPLPRFWYLPRGEKAAVVMTGDDHNAGGTTGQFNTFKAQSPAGCSVADWECIRSSSYVFPGTSIPGAEGFEADGFEIALHLSTGCSNFTRASLAGNWSDQLPSFANAFPTLDAPTTNRTHCIVWSDWAGEAIVERANGVRLDTNYYYWPGGWVQNRPGMFTGSGMPMRFADLDGSLIDVYQAATQLTDESDIDYAMHIKALIDGALDDSRGYYGVFTTNMHTDHAQHDGADAIVAEAKRRGVPVVSARQMLEWLDGRNDSSFGDLAFSGNRLQFSVQRGGAGARGLQAMLPVAGPSGEFSGLTRGGAAITTSLRTVKGIDYRVFDAAAGDYEATYGTPPSGTTPPDTTITAFTASGNSARASFASDVSGARFECSLDGTPFRPCTSPTDYTGIVSGQHTLRVRAIDPAGAVDPTAAARGFTVLAGSTGGGQSSSGGESGAAPAATAPAAGAVLGGSQLGGDRRAPRVTLRSRRVRVSRTGAATLRASCPSGEMSCRVRLRLRLGSAYVATRTLSLSGSTTRSFRLQLNRGARRRLARKRSLRVTAVTTARDAAGNQATARMAVRLLAPRRR